MDTPIIRDIIRYLTYLKKQHGFYITIHDCAGTLSAYMSELAPYNIHDNPYCLFIKKEKALWDECKAKQSGIIKKCAEGLFFGMCYAGVEEYIIPIDTQNRGICFISVSGYRVNQTKAIAKIQKLCENYGLSEKQVMKNYKQYLTKELPDRESIETLFNPLKNMLEYLHIKNDNKTPAEYPTDEDYLYGHIFAYLLSHYHMKITLSDISEACHYSPSYVRQVFKKKNGCSIFAFISNLRIQEAEKLLIHTDFPVQEIAYRTGFSDSNYFSKTFHKYSGSYPREYRKKHHKSLYL